MDGIILRITNIPGLQRYSGREWLKGIMILKLFLRYIGILYFVLCKNAVTQRRAQSLNFSGLLQKKFKPTTFYTGVAMLTALQILL
jgi:hypothetical protein